jgi:hypothetical protein
VDRLHAGRGQGLCGIHRYARSGAVYQSPSRRSGISGHGACQSAQEGEARAKVPHSIYPCAICKGWHLTSKKGATPAWARRRLGND